LLILARQTSCAELSTARRVHVAERTDTLLLSRFLPVMAGWVAPSAHVASSYRSGGGQGAAGTLPERCLFLYVQLLYYHAYPTAWHRSITT